MFLKTKTLVSLTIFSLSYHIQSVMESYLLSFQNIPNIWPLSPSPFCSSCPSSLLRFSLFTSQLVSLLPSLPPILCVVTQNYDFDEIHIRWCYFLCLKVFGSSFRSLQMLKPPCKDFMSWSLASSLTSSPIAPSLAHSSSHSGLFLQIYQDSRHTTNRKSLLPEFPQSRTPFFGNLYDLWSHIEVIVQISPSHWCLPCHGNIKLLPSSLPSTVFLSIFTDPA